MRRERARGGACVERNGTYRGGNAHGRHGERRHRVFYV